MRAPSTSGSRFRLPFYGQRSPIYWPATLSLPESSMPNSQKATLAWDDQGQPWSRVFGDRYFAAGQGIEESSYVFLRGNHLAERFAALPQHGNFCIGETGFGTGLNFLCAWRLFDQQAPSTARLHYVSAERHPLRAADLARVLRLWPQLAAYGERLAASYRAIYPGFQRLSLAHGRVQLTLLIGDACETLGQLDAGIDAWFLDGFAPAKNPDIWSPALFRQLARLSAPQATLATFTSAGMVRRGLDEAGFDMRLVKGFAQKRAMLLGRLVQPAQHSQPPWFARPAAPVPGQALIIGAGIAGCASAASLAARGWQVTLLERHARAAAEASGNRQGVLYLRPSAKATLLSRWALSGFGYSRRLLESLGEKVHWSACGVLQLAFDHREEQRQQALAEHFDDDLLHPVGAREAATLSGVELAGGGLFYPEGGWLNPPSLCQALLAHPNIRLLTHSEALHLQQDADGLWHAGQQGRRLVSAALAIVANANEARRFALAARLSLRRVRGQISYLSSDVQSGRLRTVLCGQGYLTPHWQGLQTLGASFRPDADQLLPSPAEHMENWQLLEKLSPALARHVDAPQQLPGRAAWRCTATDYMPVVGPLADAQRFSTTYQALGKNARSQPEATCPWLPGLYLNLAHGAHGLISAPLAAELLAAWIGNEPLPVPRDLAEGCHPNRFALRRTRRQQG